jgi:hypothetical protein
MRAAALLTLVLGATLTATACGGSGTVSPESVANAATKTGAQSYRVATTTKVKLNKRNVTFKGNGLFDPRHRRGRLSLDMSQLNQISGASGSPYNLGYAQFVLDGTTMYMRIPLLKQLNPSLKPWVKIDLNQAGKTQGLDFGAFLQFGQGGDPTQALQYLRATGKLKKKGTEKVRDVETTHYAGSVDLKKVATTAPANVRVELKKNVDRLIALTGERTIPVEVWVDGNGYIRRETYTSKLQVSGQKVDVDSALELYDFGTRVVAPVPPAADVTDFSGGSKGATS